MTDIDRWLLPNSAVPIDAHTTQTLIREIERLRAERDGYEKIRHWQEDEIERLRADKKLLEDGVREMANMIDRERAQNAKLEAALRAFVDWDDDIDATPGAHTARRIACVEAARAALAKAEEQE